MAEIEPGYSKCQQDNQNPKHRERDALNSIAKVKHPVKGVAQGAWKILAMGKGSGCDAAWFDFHKRLRTINLSCGTDSGTGEPVPECEG